MRLRYSLCITTVALGASLATLLSASADETSTGDKLRILYSNRFTFADNGAPLVTVEIVSGQAEVRVSAEHGVIVQPDGAGASQIQAGERWTVRLEEPSPATLREWTVVARLDPEDDDGVAKALASWRGKGFKPRRFEVGTIFGVDGEVIDSREALVGVAPVAPPNGGARALEIGRKYQLETSIHTEIVRRPRGTISATDGDITVRNPSVIWFSPRRPQDTITIADVVVGGGGSQLETRRETRRYFGSVYVTVGKDGKLTAVNAVPADKLLEGLVPSEIYPDSPFDALAAQAVAARTELLEKIGTRHLGDPFLLCSSQHCQVYSGAGREHPNTTRAVAKTRGMVMLRENGRLVDARYSASCGGHGEHNDHIWGGTPDPSLRGHVDAKGEVAAQFRNGVTQDNIESFLALEPKDAFCGATRFSRGRFRWTVDVPATELSARVATTYPDVGAVLALEPLERGVSGRISRLRIRGDRGVAIAVGDLHIRRLLGGLRSSLFVVETRGPRQKPQRFVFRGAGFGHGVGMCQLGAVGMAENGSGYSAILHHYYPHSRIKRLY